MTDQRSPVSKPRAFVSVPDPSRYFPAATVEEARQRLIRCIERDEGPALVIGAAGTGKTLLLEVIASQFRDRRCTVSLAGAQLCSRRALLQMILFQIGLPFRNLDEGELRLSLINYLKPQDGATRSILLLVDEADSLPLRLLEELRVLTNVFENGQLLVSLVLFGSANLEERFAEPKLEVFSQRISSRSYLTAFGREETFQYVRAQVAAVGGTPDELFTSEGLEALFAATDGIPRLVNQLGDQLLWMANETGYSPLDGAIVQQAWSELQQLPAPWNQETSEMPASAVEFGELDGSGLLEDDLEVQEVDDDDLPASIPISVSHSFEQLGIETIDVTEQLLEQLDQLDSSLAPADEPKSRNPFDEAFDSEEVVLDRYSEFETQLLDSAQRVFNQVDAAFAEQLKQCEVVEEIAIANDPVDPFITEESTPSVTTTPQDSQLPGEATTDSSVFVAEPTTLDAPGELLVIENERGSKAEIVPGGQFRQLFSNLESGGNSACTG